MTEPKHPKHSDFDYKLAFSRNIGWISELEQEQLQTKKIAIAGLGGVGGFHLLSLVRLGIPNFHIADLDKFEIQNFNRQIGATLQTIDCQKIDVLEQMAKNINPNCEIKCFNTGITENNIDEFLEGVDLYVDGLDYFCLRIRAQVFKRCRELKIPAITAAPLGMGTAYLIFMPEAMSFEEYFRFENLSDEEIRYSFLIGLAPKTMSFKYLVDPNSINLAEKRGPSTVMACELCAGVTSTEALKILLHRQPIYPAPYYHLFDAYFGKFHRGKMFWGNKNPLQIVKRYLVKKMIARPVPPKPIFNSIDSNHSDLEQILDLARWAPSAENNQPWHFEIKNNHQIVIYVKDDPNVDRFDFNGLTMFSCGALLESIRLAATQYGRDFSWEYKSLTRHEHQFNIELNLNKNIKSDPLANFIFFRSVYRQRCRLSPLTQHEKNLLNAAVGDQFEIQWFESRQNRLKMSKLDAAATRIRLQTPEFYEMNQKTIDFKNQFSQVAIPLNAVGLSWMSQLAMKWAIQKNARMAFINNYMGAAYLSAFELALIPGIFSSAHFVLLPNKKLDVSSTNLYIQAGIAIQKFWLTATQLGLVLQPNFAPLVFNYYANHHINFTENKSLINAADRLAKEFNTIFEGNTVLFKGRIGRPTSPKVSVSRSVRKPLADLMIKKTENP